MASSRVKLAHSKGTADVRSGQTRTSRPRSASSGLPQSKDFVRPARLVLFVPDVAFRFGGGVASAFQ
jgi:hypothetical protein